MSRQDWMLMHRVAAGEEEAVRELYDRFGTLVYRAARQFMPTQAEAEDAVQEVFVRLWQTADRYDPRRAKLVTWVMMIARRHLIDRLRRQAARPEPGTLEVGEQEPASDQPTTRPTREELDSTLQQRLAELSEIQREVIERAYLQGFTLREVSEQLDAPLGTVKSALSRGLARLRERSEADIASS